MLPAKIRSILVPLSMIILMVGGIPNHSDAAVYVSTDKTTYLVGETIHGYAQGDGGYGGYGGYGGQNDGIISVSISPYLPEAEAQQQSDNYTVFSYLAQTAGTYTITGTTSNYESGSTEVTVIDATVKPYGKQILRVDNGIQGHMGLRVSSTGSETVYFSEPSADDWDVAFPGLMGPFGTIGGSQPTDQGIEVRAAAPGFFSVTCSYRLTTGSEVLITSSHDENFAAMRVTTAPDPLILELDGLGDLTATIEPSEYASDYPRMSTESYRWSKDPAGATSYDFSGATDTVTATITALSPTADLNNPDKAEFSFNLAGSDIEGGPLFVSARNSSAVKIRGAAITVNDPDAVCVTESATITAIFSPENPEYKTFSYDPAELKASESTNGSTLTIQTPVLYLNSTGFTRLDDHAEGTLTVTYTATIDGTEYSASGEAKIKVNPIDAVTIDGFPEDGVCICDGPLTLTAQVQCDGHTLATPSDLVITWEVVTGDATIGDDGVLTPGMTPGPIKVTATITPGGANDKYVYNTITGDASTEQNDFEVKIEPESSEICVGESATLTATVTCGAEDITGKVDLMWSTGQMDPTIMVTNEGAGTITHTVVATYCGRTKTASATVQYKEPSYRLLLGANDSGDVDTADDWVGENGHMVKNYLVIDGCVSDSRTVVLTFESAGSRREKPRVGFKRDWRESGPPEESISLQVTSSSQPFFIYGLRTSKTKDDIRIIATVDGERVASETITCFNPVMPTGSKSISSVPVGPVVVNDTSAALYGGNLFGIQYSWRDPGDAFLYPSKLNNKGGKWSAASIKVLWGRKIDNSLVVGSNDSGASGTSAALDVAPAESDLKKKFGRTGFRMRDVGLTSQVDGTPVTYFFGHPTAASPDMPQIDGNSAVSFTSHYYKPIGPFPLTYHLVQGKTIPNLLTKSQVAGLTKDLNIIYSQLGIYFEAQTEVNSNQNDAYMNIETGSFSNFPGSTLDSVAAIKWRSGRINVVFINSMNDTTTEGLIQGQTVISSSNPGHAGFTSPACVIAASHGDTSSWSDEQNRASRVRCLAHELFHYIALMGEEAHQNSDPYIMTGRTYDNKYFDSVEGSHIRNSSVTPTNPK
ncbi:MAG: hypothetical protein H0U72_05285 [Nitrosospira sp.]|nr:hypothetical protein [Nitrosospira sp.]